MLKRAQPVSMAFQMAVWASNTHVWRADQDKLDQAMAHDYTVAAGFLAHPAMNCHERVTGG